MKNITQIITAFVALAFATTAGADEYQHVDSMANRIQNKTRQLLRASRMFEHTPEYEHVVADVAEMERIGRHIHELAHHEASVFHLEQDLQELDTQFHHVVDVFLKIERDAAYGYGHSHGNTNRVRRILVELQETIHHMQEDVAAIRARTRPQPHTAFRAPVRQTYGPAQVYRPQMVQPAHGYHSGGGYGNIRQSCYGQGRSGITLGNENFQINFGF